MRDSAKPVLSPKAFLRKRIFAATHAFALRWRSKYITHIIITASNTQPQQ
jgi:hypothetical protein